MKFTKEIEQSIMPKDSTVFVRAKDFFDGKFKLGILIRLGNDGLWRFKFLHYNYVIQSLDWICSESVEFVILRTRFKNQYMLSI